MKEFAVAAILAASWHAAQAATELSSSQDEWLEGTYARNDYTSYTVDELRETSTYGWRASAKVSTFHWLALVGSYDYQTYDMADSLEDTCQRFRLAKYGVQTHLPIGSQVQLLLQATRQERSADGILDNGLSDPMRWDYTLRGFGYLAGLRWPFMEGTEVDASYEYAPLRTHFGDYDFQERFSTVALTVLVPLTESFKLSLTAEQAKYTDTNEELNFSQKSKNENLLLGLRYSL